MLDAALIFAREAAETMLFLAVLYGSLTRMGRTGLLPAVMSGALLGGLAGAAVAAWWRADTFSLAGQAWLTILGSLFILVVLTRNVGSAARMRRQVSDQVDVWTERAAAPASVFVFAALIVLREVIEAVFLLQRAASEHGPGEVTAGLSVGIVAALALAVVWKAFKPVRARLLAIFQVSAVLLVILTVQSLLSGVQDLLVALAEGRAQPHWASALARGLEDPMVSGWLCALLAAYPLYHLAACWWKEASRSRKWESDWPA